MPLLPLLLFLFCLAPGQAQTEVGASPVNLDGAPQRILDQGELSLVRDPSGEMSLAEVRAAWANGEFRPLQGNLGLGYSPDAVWLRFDLEQGQPEILPRWLEIPVPYLDDIRLYHIDPAGRIDQRRGGDLLPQSAKEENYRAHAFELQLAPGHHQIYLRIQTSSTLVAIVKLWQPEAFKIHLRDSYFAYGLYFSLILAVMLFNAASALISRRPIFIAYVAYLLLTAVQWLGISGFIAEYLFAEQPLLANLTLGMSLSLSAAMAFIFFSLLFELPQYHRWLYRLNQLGALISLLTAIATPLGHYQSFAPWLLLVAVVSLAACPWPLSRLWRSGMLWNRLLVVAYAAFAVLLSINILSTLALIPYNEPVVYAGMLSNIFHIMVLHVAILLHYRKIEQDHAKAIDDAAMAQQKLAMEQRHRKEQDKLLAMISHEIRTPVSVIDAATENLKVLEEEASSLDDLQRQQRQQRHERIGRAVQRLTALIDLTDARIKYDMENWEPAAVAVDPKGFTEEVISLLNVSPPGRVRFEAPGQLPSLSCDPAMLRFALMNLIDNACKYSPQEAPVRVWIEATANAGNEEITWHVEDRGGGIAVGMEEEIFAKYTRLGEQNGKAGLGLGLYLGRYVISRQGGQIALVSTSGPGAHFICRLPVGGGAA